MEALNDNNIKLTLASYYTNIPFNKILSPFGFGEHPNENLKNLVINCHITPDGKFNISITCDLADDIDIHTSMFKENNISPLIEGFKHATSVKRLKIHHNYTHTNNVFDENFVEKIPNCLESLDLSGMRTMDELPCALPDSLLSINISNTNITKLPEKLPPGLIEIKANNANLTRLPQKLPNTLKILHCDNNSLTSFPNDLPDSIIELSFNNNKKMYGNIDKLPAALITFMCADTHIFSLPKELPSTLKILNCENCNILKLPELLPNGLEKLNCKSNNYIHELPNLPLSLKYVNIDFNNPCLKLKYKNLEALSSEVNEPKNIINKINNYNKKK